MSTGTAQRHIRALDVGFVALTALAWLPLVALIAAAVAITSGRPILFRQSRSRRDGQTFEMIKFRSMVNGDNPLIPDPTRITKIGSILRRTSLDELPQLFHVLRGEMSLVGPRPMLPEQARELTERQLMRLSVRPGLTGLAQINGRNELRWDERLEYDLDWVTSQSVRLYLRTLGQTFRVITRGEGVTGHDPSDRFLEVEAPAPVIRLIDFDLTHVDETEQAA